MAVVMDTAQRDAARDVLERRYGRRLASSVFEPRLRRPPPDLEPPSGPGSPRLRPPLTPPDPSDPRSPRLRMRAPPPFAVRALNNMSYGATPATVAEFNAFGSTDQARLAGYVDWQLDPQAIDDGPVEQRLVDGGYTTLGKTLTQLWSDHVIGNPEYQVRMRPAWEVQRAAFVRAAYSRRQLLEVMTAFWHDHFNVTATDYDAGPVYAHYDRNITRVHAFGNFRSMLEAMARSTSMMYYLDNVSNTRSGPNENFARELLELHTFGAENYLGFTDPTQVPPCPEDPAYPIGYTDIDVYETAAAFTGWSVKNGHWQYPTENDGTFVYRAAWHDTGPKLVLGMYLPPEQPAMKDGQDILNRVASHPRVAKFICKKLIRRFFADHPDQGLIDSAAAVFRQHWQHPDQIKLTLRHIMLSDAAYESWGRKTRRPFDAVAAAMRVLGADWTLRIGHPKSDEFMWRMGFTGHSPYDWPAPNGYPDTSAAWSGANTFAMTWRMLNWLTETRDNDVALMPILDITRAGVPVEQWTARRLVDFWCMRAFGYLPTASRYATLLGFMAQNGNPDNYVIADNDSWSVNDLKRHYNHQRLRSMVSLILMSPEFLRR